MGVWWGIIFKYCDCRTTPTTTQFDVENQLEVLLNCPQHCIENCALCPIHTPVLRMKWTLDSIANNRFVCFCWCWHGMSTSRIPETQFDCQSDALESACWEQMSERLGISDLQTQGARAPCWHQMSAWAHCAPACRYFMSMTNSHLLTIDFHGISCQNVNWHQISTRRPCLPSFC